ncbi:hypothetical protein Tco_0620714 [Tanacetum coccineum]
MMTQNNELKGDVKAITSRSGVDYDGPTIPHTPSPLSKEVENETEATKDKTLLVRSMLKKCLDFRLVAQVAIPYSILHRSSSPSFTPFEGGDFILEEIETFLHTPYELSNLDDDYYDVEGDILYLEKLLNEDPSPTLPPMKNYDFKQVDVTLTKPLIEEPPKLELKDLPSHLEYAFLEGTDKLLVIISKD